jgi:hypothetical protein
MGSAVASAGAGTRRRSSAMLERIRLSLAALLPVAIVILGEVARRW